MFLFLQAAFGGTVWRFAFFVSGSFFIPVVNVSAILHAVFGEQGGCFLFQKFFGMETVKAF